MPVYEYIALDSRGNKKKGMIDSGSLSSARLKLREAAMYPVELREAETRREREAVVAAGVGGGGIFGKVGLREVAAMTRQLSTLLGAGLPLVPSLTTLVAQTANPRMKAILAQIRENVNEGNSLTASMSCFPHAFPPLYVNMVRAGEASGKINLVLERLADFMENQQTLRTKIRSALAYPLLMFLIGSLVLFFLITFVVPNITKIFAEMHQNLPAITVFLIAVSTFFKNFWWGIALAGAAGFLFLRYGIINTERGGYIWDRLKLKVPLFGGLNQKMAMARFSRTLGTLLQSGVPLLAAMNIVKNVVNNRIIADEIQHAGREIEEGQNLSTPLSRSGLFPPIAIEMISVGEQSGNLEPMLYRIADAYEKEVEAGILTLTALLEPIMILVMGLIVGFVVVSVLLPIFEMNQLVR
ncbi:MAG TPA: type II secretion system inner membrane protein GspF [Syntrophales bacterium]|nr:type II secretion system inner membrane protein GspF [Syntrophales bacterium]HPC33151.1 type II secretion system inner membrane protein GspF [Syntrophales bacterium]